MSNAKGGEILEFTKCDQKRSCELERVQRNSRGHISLILNSFGSKRSFLSNLGGNWLEINKGVMWGGAGWSDP